MWVCPKCGMVFEAGSRCDYCTPRPGVAKPQDSVSFVVMAGVIVGCTTIGAVVTLLVVIYLYGWK